MISRLVRSHIETLLRSHPAVVVVGPRGAGKSTTARTFSDLCFNLERNEDAERLDFRWEDCMESGRLVVLNEIHQRPELFLRIRAVLDEHRGGHGRFLITESFRSSMIDVLGGHSAVWPLSPLLVHELETSQHDSHWRHGGHPEFWNSEDPFPKVQHQYLDRMMQRDLPNAGLAVPPRTTERLFKMLAALHGMIYNASRIGKNLGVSYHTVNSYVNYLDRAGLTRFLPAARLEIRKRLVKSPKLYWRDSGLFHALVGLEGGDDLFSKPWVGASWEGWIIEQIITRIEAAGERVEACHFSTSDHHALDLLFDFRGKRWAIDTTISSSPSVEMIDSLASTAMMVGADHAVLVSRTRKPGDRGGVISLNLSDTLNQLLDSSEAP